MNFILQDSLDSAEAYVRTELTLKFEAARLELARARRDEVIAKRL